MGLTSNFPCFNAAAALLFLAMHGGSSEKCKERSTFADTLRNELLAVQTIGRNLIGKAHLPEGKPRRGDGRNKGESED